MVSGASTATSTSSSIVSVAESRLVTRRAWTRRSVCGLGRDLLLTRVSVAARSSESTARWLVEAGSATYIPGMTDETRRGDACGPEVADGPADEPDKHWIVELDETRCTLCEACAKHCPTGALAMQQQAQRLRLTFDAARCDGCPGGNDCEDSCVEKALTRSERTGAAPAEGAVVLLAGDALKCAQCNEVFGSVRKLERVVDKGHASVPSDLCPVCRRTKLVVKFIDEERMPEGQAEYRSTVEILRKAGKLNPSPPKGKPPPGTHYS